jgi:hypothetical protein
MGSLACRHGISLRGTVSAGVCWRKSSYSDGAGSNCRTAVSRSGTTRCRKERRWLSGVPPLQHASKASAQKVRSVGCRSARWMVQSWRKPVPRRCGEPARVPCGLLAQRPHLLPQGGEPGTRWPADGATACHRAHVRARRAMCRGRGAAAALYPWSSRQDSGPTARRHALIPTDRTTVGRQHARLRVCRARGALRFAGRRAKSPEHLPGRGRRAGPGGERGRRGFHRGAREGGGVRCVPARPIALVRAGCAPVRRRHPRRRGVTLGRRAGLSLRSAWGTDPGTEGCQGGTRTAARQGPAPKRSRRPRLPPRRRRQARRRGWARRPREEDGGEGDGAAAAWVVAGRVPGYLPACFKGYGKGEVITKVTDGWEHPAAPSDRCRQPSGSSPETRRGSRVARRTAPRSFRTGGAEPRRPAPVLPADTRPVGVASAPDNPVRFSGSQGEDGHPWVLTRCAVWARGFRRGRWRAG